MERMSYEEIIDQITEAASWLASIGAAREQDRLHVHLSNIRRLAEARRSGTVQEIVEQLGQTQLLWSLVEAVEFAEAYAALKGYEPESLRQKLREALKGPANPVVETASSNRGRNTMFELNLAGRLRRKGFRIHLPHNPDILFEVEGMQLYIQCKRPFNVSTVWKNMLAANAQVTRDIEASGDSSARGLIAISVSRVLNPGDRLLVTETEADVGKKLGDEVQSLGHQHSHVWKRASDKRIIGFLFHIITPVFIEGATLLTAAEQVVMFMRPDAIGADRQVLRYLSDILGETN